LNKTYLDNAKPGKCNSLKNLEFLTYEDIKTKFEKISNIQGVNKLSPSKISSKNLKNSSKENTLRNSQEFITKMVEENKESILNNTPNKSSLKNKLNKRSKSCNSFLAMEEQKHTPEKYLDNENKRQNSSFICSSPKETISLLENDFNFIFNQTQKKINFKNNLFEKVESIKSSQRTNDLNKNDFNSIETRLSSATNLNFHNNFLPDKSSKKIFDKIKEFNSDFNLTNYNYQNNFEFKNGELDRPLSSKKSNFLKKKSTISNESIINKTNELNRQIIIQKGEILNDNKIVNNKNTNNELSKKINCSNNISSQAKIKFHEINLITERIKSKLDEDKKQMDVLKNKNLHSEVFKYDTENAIYKSKNYFFLFIKILSKFQSKEK